MCAEIRQLVPGRRHFVAALGNPEIPGAALVPLLPGSPWSLWRQLRRYRIGLAPVLFTPGPHPVRAAAFLLAPRKILAYNARLERHHLRLGQPVASLLFLAGVPLDRIFLRPRWLVPWKRDRSVVPAGCSLVEGRPPVSGRRRIAVLSPYLPYPLSHGGAVRMFNLLREAAREFDLYLFAFSEGKAEPGPLLDFCCALVLVDKPRYREPRWSTWRPPEVLEFRSPAMRDALRCFRREFSIGLLQVEYTHLAPYGGDVLVEHDVTFDLYQQISKRRPSLAARWDLFRWRRFETRAIERFRRVIVMSEKDARLLRRPQVRVVENGVDLDRFEPRPELPGANLLFIGSFRHFPNIEAYRFLAGEIWPLLRDRYPDLGLTVVAGPDPLLYWRAFTSEPVPRPDARLRILGFVADVRPLYHQANIVLVPTTVSAGTNIKVLEALAMERAVVSTTSGCAGLGLENIRVADDPRDFAAAVARLLEDPEERRRLARAARAEVARRFDWKTLGEKQRALYRELLPG